MKNLLRTLNDVPVGKRCRVCSINSELPIRKRLIELGFSENSEIDKLLVGPGGSPVALRVCGAVFALRRDDAESIAVTAVD